MLTGLESWVTLGRGGPHETGKKVNCNRCLHSAERWDTNLQSQARTVTQLTISDGDSHYASPTTLGALTVRLGTNSRRRERHEFQFRRAHRIGTGEYRAKRRFLPAMPVSGGISSIEGCARS